jgi:hypothetical protein
MNVIGGKNHLIFTVDMVIATIILLFSVIKSRFMHLKSSALICGAMGSYCANIQLSKLSNPF